MGGRNGFEFDAYIEMLCNPDFADYSAGQFAQALEVKTTLIYDWNRKVDWESIKTERRKRYAKLLPKVDNALFKATQEGDVPAIRTFYERFDQWTPSSKVLTEHSVSDTEVDEALNELIERKRAAISALDASGRVEDAAPAVGENPPSEGGAPAVLPAEPGAAEIH